MAKHIVVYPGADLTKAPAGAYRYSQDAQGGLHKVTLGHNNCEIPWTTHPWDLERYFGDTEYYLPFIVVEYDNPALTEEYTSVVREFMVAFTDDIPGSEGKSMCFHRHSADVTYLGNHVNMAKPQPLTDHLKDILDGVACLESARNWRPITQDTTIIIPRPAPTPQIAMSWEEALAKMQEGYVVTRVGWIRDTYVGLTNTGRRHPNTLTFRNHMVYPTVEVLLDNFFVRSLKGAPLKPWHPSVYDTRANDWVLFTIKGATP